MFKFPAPVPQSRKLWGRATSPETWQDFETNMSPVTKIASLVLKNLAFHRACSNELNSKDQVAGINSNQVVQLATKYVLPHQPTKTRGGTDMPVLFSHEAKCIGINTVID